MRKKEIDKLKSRRFDLLVIGGGATGTGIAVDAQSRGLSVALIERRDFSSETSSRSTKLVHGGVRYLENAVKDLDPGQLELVRDALKERTNFFRNAPHLSHDLPILTPVYSWFEAGYYFTGLRTYDFLARNKSVPSTSFKMKGAVLKEFPMLNEKGLKGGLLYHDGQFDDARMNVSLAKTAIEHGVVALNYVELVSLIKEGGKIAGVQLRDTLTGEIWNTYAKVVANATGAFTDSIRLMDDPDAVRMLSASSGSHIILDAKYISPQTGILIPKTEDGRVVFILPWNGKTLVGTTDNAAEICENPKPSQSDVDFILETVAPLYKNPPTEKEILSRWTGLRPLVCDPQQKGTASLSRDHVIDVSVSGLVSIAGGKWTTYRKMAQDLVDKVVETGNLQTESESKTEDMSIAGAHHFTPELGRELALKYKIATNVTLHLTQAYGDRAEDILRIAQKSGRKLLHPKHPYLEAEVQYGVIAEAAQTIEDILARRTRMGFLDEQAALDSVERVSELMAPLLQWDEAQRQKRIQSAKEYLKTS